MNETKNAFAMIMQHQKSDYIGGYVTKYVSLWVKTYECTCNGDILLLLNKGKQKMAALPLLSRMPKKICKKIQIVEL